MASCATTASTVFLASNKGALEPFAGCGHLLIKDGCLAGQISRSDIGIPVRPH